MCMCMCVSVHPPHYHRYIYIYIYRSLISFMHINSLYYVHLKHCAHIYTHDDATTYAHLYTHTYVCVYVCACERAYIGVL